MTNCCSKRPGDAGRTGILARGWLGRNYGITALRTGILAEPAFLPVADCDGITALRHYRIPVRPALPAIPGLRHSGIPAFRYPGIPVSRHSGIPAFRYSGIPVFRHYGITALRTGILAEPAFLPVADCDGITVLRHYELGFWQNQHSCPWRAVTELRHYGITNWDSGRTGILARGGLGRQYGITALRDYGITGFR